MSHVQQQLESIEFCIYFYTMLLDYPQSDANYKSQRIFEERLLRHFKAAHCRFWQLSRRHPVSEYLLKCWAILWKAIDQDSQVSFSLYSLGSQSESFRFPRNLCKKTIPKVPVKISSLMDDPLTHCLNKENMAKREVTPSRTSANISQWRISKSLSTFSCYRNYFSNISLIIYSYHWGLTQ